MKLSEKLDAFLRRHQRLFLLLVLLLTAFTVGVIRSSGPKGQVLLYQAF